MATWLVGNDNTIILPGLHSLDQERQSPGSISYYKSGLTLSAVVTNEAGATVATIASGEYISGTDGDWKIIVPAATALVAGTLYTVTVDLTGDGKSAKWTLTRRAANRTT